MEYTVLLEKRVVRQLRSLSPETSTRVTKTLEALREGFSARLDIKKLKGLKNHYRVRVGDHRILFELVPTKQIIVYAVLQREKAYG